MARPHQTGDGQPTQGLTGDKSRGRKHTGIIHAGFLGIIQTSTIPQLVRDPADDATDEDGKGGPEW